MEFNGDSALGFLRQGRHHEPNRRMPVTNLKTLSAIAILTAAIASPVFAQDGGLVGSTNHVRAHDQRNFRGANNLSNAPAATSDEYRNVENFGWSGRDPSRVGGEFPYFGGISGN
jgi:hypothetical protein